LYQDLEAALKLGIFNSASCLTRVGAQEGLLTRKDLKLSKSKIGLKKMNL